MEYNKYIELGFNRTDMDDDIEFSETGYYGFTLDKEINSKMSIGVLSNDLDKPKLYIRKKDFEAQFHIVNITCECLIDLCSLNGDGDFNKKDLLIDFLDYCNTGGWIKNIDTSRIIEDYLKNH